MVKTLLLLVAGICQAAAPPVEPVRICEILRNPGEWRGKTVAVIGRYSFRTDARFLSEAPCEGLPANVSSVWAASMQVMTDSEDGPKLPDEFDIDTVAAGRKLKLIRKATTLGKFRFGSLEYDRWAVVYGRVEPSPEFASPPSSVPRGSRPGLEPAPLHLVIRGEGLVFFVSTE